MKFEVKNRWSEEVQFIADIACVDDENLSIKRGLAVKWVLSNSADLSNADFSGVPTIERIHQTIYQAALEVRCLDMATWHKCKTTHCRAGWVVHLAGAAGAALELAMGTATAAALIYMKSDPNLEKVPDFYCDNNTALEDMKRLAERRTKL